jgi:hypothetical protein
MHCPCTGINIPRFLLSTLIGFAFIFGSDFVIHQKLLMDMYIETKELWRPHETMQEFFPYMLAAQLLFAAIPAYIYTRNHEGKGIMEGVRFGIPLGLLFAVTMAASYVWLPISATLAGSWGAAGFVQGLGLGIIYSITYKK